MFSTSMMASSTTSPRAMASPPSERLMPKPRSRARGWRRGGEGNGGERDRRRAQVREKEEQHHRHQHRAQQQRGGDVPQRKVDELRGPEQRRVEREPGLLDGRPHLRQRRLDPGRHHLGVGAELPRDHDHQPALAVHPALAHSRLPGLHHTAEVLQAEHAAIVLAHRRPSEQRGRRHLPLRAHGEPLILPVDHPGAAHPGGLGCRLHRFRDTDAVGPQAFRVELDLDLAHLAAEHRHLGHARRGEQARAEHPVHEAPLLHG
jgi:hypothetical protein